MNFKEEVTDLSFEVPVLVDFWAPWCGPCQFLGPVLKELSENAHGAWKLVKINVDDNSEISATYGIKGIPDVRLFVDGEQAAGFTGAMSKQQIENWLLEHLPDERKKELDRILNELDENKELALKNLEGFVSKNPDFLEAAMILAENIVFNDPGKAMELVSPLTAQVKYLERIDNIKALVRLLSYQERSNSEVHEKLENAKKSIKQSDFDSALQTLIEAVMIDKSYAGELPRQATVAVFKLLGEDHALSQKYRRRFDMALY